MTVSSHWLWSLLPSEVATPIEDIGLAAFVNSTAVHEGTCHSPDLLRGGQRRELEVRIKPLGQEVAEQAFSVQLNVRFHNRAANKVEEQSFSVPVAIGGVGNFEEIPNPYAAYSGGAIVSEPSMLFGRTELVDRILRQVAYGPVAAMFCLVRSKTFREVISSP